MQQEENIHILSSQLEALLEGLVPEEEALLMEGHLAECGECRAEADLLFEAEMLLESWTAENHRRALLSRREHENAASTLLRIGGRMVQWLSPLWAPDFAGELVTAADEAVGNHTFYLDEGSVQLTCRWWASSDDRPAAFSISWYADVVIPTEMWIRFVKRDSPAEVLAEKHLGRDLSGEAGWYAKELGFDPTRLPWALILLIAEADT